MRMAWALAALGYGPGLQAHTVAAQEKVENAPDPFVHLTGAAFPAWIGDFRRVSVYRYDDQGADMSIGYNLIRNGRKLAAVTFYIYPSYFRAAEADNAARCDRDFHEIVKSIEKQHEGVVPRRADAPRPPDGIIGTTKFASYRYEEVFDTRPQPLRSDAWLSCRPHSDWLITYRASWPESNDVSSDVEQLLHAINWPHTLPKDD